MIYENDMLLKNNASFFQLQTENATRINSAVKQVKPTRLIGSFSPFKNKNMAPDSSTVNKDELEAPDWLNEAFFTKVLQQYERKAEIKVQSLKLTPATAKGDHFASVMFRAVIAYNLSGTSKSKSLILKTMPELEGLKKMVLQDSHVFETEIGMYTQVVPKFEAILKAAGDDVKLGPTCIYHSLKPKKIIIFEDIMPLGYSVIRQRQANLEEAKLAYAKIAKWHAVSYKLNLEQPDCFEDYRYGLLNTKYFQNSKGLRNGLSFFIEMLSAHEDLAPYKPYFQKLQAQNFFENCIAAFEEYRQAPQSDAYYVLCHGDFHCKNMMFKGNAEMAVGDLEDILLLDFQLCYMGPMVNDIIYSMYTLLTAELRHKKLNELLDLYFDELLSTLKKIGFTGPMPQISEFRKQRKHQKAFELFMFTTFLPIWLKFCDADFDSEEVVNSDDRRRNLYKNSAYLADVRVMLPKYLKWGYFDDN